MRTLFHFPLSPASRTVRLVLGEKRLPFEAIVERARDTRQQFPALNPLGDVPVRLDPNGLSPHTAYFNVGYH